MTAEEMIWVGILLCISQSAMFSGLNLAFFSLSRLQLEVETDPAAKKILALRQDSNFLLATILWGNVGINVLLTLLSDSVLAGALAFIFSTVFITLCGEILPQAYFSRNALKMASRLAPVLRFYQFLLYPVAKPCALVLDAWLGKEGIDYLHERELASVIRAHVEAEDAELNTVEGTGALNFLTVDDISALDEGEPVDEASIISLPTKIDLPVLPEIIRSADDPFLQQINRSGHRWVVITDDDDKPQLILDADGALRAALFSTDQPFDLYDYCRRPVVVTEEGKTLRQVIQHLRSMSNELADDEDPVDYDVVLVWTAEKRIITGADILGKLLKGIDAAEAVH